MHKQSALQSQSRDRAPWCQTLVLIQVLEVQVLEIQIQAPAQVQVQVLVLVVVVLILVVELERAMHDDSCAALRAERQKPNT